MFQTRRILLGKKKEKKQNPAFVRRVNFFSLVTAALPLPGREPVTGPAERSSRPSTALLHLQLSLCLPGAVLTPLLLPRCGYK